MMIKKEFIVEAKNDNQEILYDWINDTKHLLFFVSEDEGCGCCVSIFRVCGLKEVIETFPKEILL